MLPGLILHSIGTIFAICIFSKKLKAHDSILGITSMASKILGTIVIMFAIQDYQAYLHPLLEMLYGTTTIALRSLCSKLVSHQELGRLNSLVGVVEALTPAIYAPLYSRIYIATIDYLPGAVFILSIVSSIPALVIFSDSLQIQFIGLFRKTIDRPKCRETGAITSHPNPKLAICDFPQTSIQFLI
ncbi:unnamed protein product [Parnassius apollo]|uniref:(apollo) hypothetical protein n=1 Tax=Parnassius apollo TaxID=110799 RepID=A0A8S3Y995_PARAO|nr:unnamed protein product [Parnassius apollo]